MLGGFLTTNYSWRWSFRINVIVAPLAVLGAFLFMPAGVGERRKVPIDVPGAAMIASGMFLLVFAISEGGTYGWWRPTESLSIGGFDLWPRGAPIAVAPVAMVVALAILASFVVYERRKERRGRNPLFEFSQLKFKTFRYGLLTVSILSMGQLGVLFALPLFLQDAVHLTAEQNGYWMLPIGVAVIVGSQLGGWLTRRISVTWVVRLGLFIEAAGLVWIIATVSPGVTFWALAGGLSIFGMGIGFATSQITGVVLFEIEAQKAGVASGANSTARQVGAALGAAIIGSVITVRTTNLVLSGLAHTRLGPGVAAQVHRGVQVAGPSYVPPASLHHSDLAAIESLFNHALSSATRWALVFAFAVVFLGACASMLIPLLHIEGKAEEAAERLEMFEAVNPASVPLDVLDDDEDEDDRQPVAD